MRLAQLLAAASLGLIGAFVGCRCETKPMTTQRWFAENRKRFVAIREMIAADQGRVRYIRMSFGGLAGASSDAATCGSPLRGAGFPWDCTVGERHESATDLSDVARILGIPAARLREYERTMPANAIGVRDDGRCAPKGSITFYLFDANSSPCVGMNNVVWSPTVPVVDPVACQTTVARVYRSLGDGFYEDACASPP